MSKTRNLKVMKYVHDVYNNNSTTNPDVEHIFLRGDFSCMHDLFTATSSTPKMLLYQNHTNYHHFHSKNLQNVQNQQGFQGFSDQDLGKYLCYLSNQTTRGL